MLCKNYMPIGKNVGLQIFCNDMNVGTYYVLFFGNCGSSVFYLGFIELILSLNCTV